MSETEHDPYGGAADEFYCPGCGARYPADGTCNAGHEPLELKPLGQTASPAESGEAVPAGVPAEAPEAAPAATDTETGVEVPPEPAVTQQTPPANVLADAIGRLEQTIADLKTHLGI